MSNLRHTFFTLLFYIQRKKWPKNLEKQIFILTFASHLKTRAFSSAGLEHLPYKQRVGGSNPSTPTGVFPVISSEIAGFFCLYTSHLKCNKYTPASIFMLVRYVLAAYDAYFVDLYENCVGIH